MCGSVVILDFGGFSSFPIHQDIVGPEWWNGFTPPRIDLALFLRCFGFSFPRSPRPRRDTCFPSIRLPIIGSGTASIICVFSFLSLFVCVIFPCADVVACPCFSFLFIRHRPEGLKCFFFCWSPLRSHRHERDWRLSFLLFLKRKASISSSWVMHWSPMIYAVLVAMTDYAFY